MSTFLPVGYFRWVPTFSLAGSIKQFQIVFMGVNSVASPSFIDGSVMRPAFLGTGAPFAAANMYVGWTLDRTECWSHLSGSTEYFLDETSIVGTKAGSNGTPINTSILIKKNTGLSGRQYRGRFMVPNMTVPEANINQAGIIDSTGLAAIQGQWNTAMTSWTATAYDPVLGHSSSEVAPTGYSTVSVTPKVGSMPHRIR